MSRIAISSNHDAVSNLSAHSCSALELGDTSEENLTSRKRPKQCFEALEDS